MAWLLLQWDRKKKKKREKEGKKKGKGRKKKKCRDLSKVVVKLGKMRPAVGL